MCRFIRLWNGSTPEVQPTIVGHRGGFASHIHSHWTWVIPLPEELKLRGSRTALVRRRYRLRATRLHRKPTDRVGIIGHWQTSNRHRGKILLQVPVRRTDPTAAVATGVDHHQQVGGIGVANSDPTSGIDAAAQLRDWSVPRHYR